MDLSGMNLLFRHHHLVHDTLVYWQLVQLAEEEQLVITV